jgi:electron transport complex protein RnfD
MATTTIKDIMTNKLELSSSPHIHSKLSVKKSMWFVIYALIPSVISAIIFFGISQLIIIAVAIGFSVLTEFVVKKIRKQKATLWDGTAIITGLLLALVLPPDFSPVLTALGAIVGIVIGKEVFGGLGFNVFNPALVGRAFLQAAFPVKMTTWLVPNFAVDSVTSATPLGGFKFDGMITDLSTMFFGNTGGCIGETSTIAILIGGIFLLVTSVANWRIPISMIIGMLIFSGLFWVIDPASYQNPLFHIMGGGFLFAAFFMATDWVSSPITNKGMWIFGLGISLVIVVIRLFGGLPEGVMYAILFMNAFVPMINKYTRPKVFGAQ